MAQGDGVIYNEFKRALLAGEVDLDTVGDTLKLALVTGYTQNIDTHLAWADVSASEVTNVSGYTAGGETVTGQGVDLNSAGNTGDFDAADVTWSSLQVSQTPSHAILYSVTAGVLIAAWEVTTVTNGGDYTIQWNASGVITLS